MLFLLSQLILRYRKTSFPYSLHIFSPLMRYACTLRQSLPIQIRHCLLILLLVSLHLGYVALMGTQANLFNQRLYRPENSSLVPGKHEWLRNSSVNKQPSCLRSIFTVLGWSEKICSISLILCDIWNCIYHQPIKKLLAQWCPVQEGEEE